MIRFEQVSKSFTTYRGRSPTTALHEISLAVAKGSIFGIIGRSGAGKSTLLRLVNRLEQPSSGRVLVAGQDLAGLQGAELRERRRHIGMIFQHFNLLSARTVAGNVALPLELAGADGRAIRRRTGELLELVGLADKRDRYPVELSGGQKQRVGIARALACDPEILLSDEATSALDPETTASILALLRGINAELGLTILLITHEMTVVRDVCDRVGVLDAGRLVEEGAVAQVLSRPRAAATQALLEAADAGGDADALARRFAAARDAATHHLLALRLDGSRSGDLIIGQLARRFGIDPGILRARIDQVGEGSIGTMVLKLPATRDQLQAIIAFLRPLTASVEALDHVPADLRAAG